MPEISLDTTIAALKAILNNGRIASDEEWEATTDAILYLERVKRLEEMVRTTESKACGCGQIHRRVFAPEILKYLQTGEDFDA